jgi:hypothetical protein
VTWRHRAGLLFLLMITARSPRVSLPKGNY